MRPGLSAGCCKKKKTKKDEHDEREGLFLGRLEEPGLLDRDGGNKRR